MNSLVIGGVVTFMFIFLMKSHNLFTGAIVLTLSLGGAWLWFRLFIVLVHRFKAQHFTAIIALLAFFCLLTQGFSLPFLGSSGNAISLGVTFSVILSILAVYIKIQSEKAKAGALEHVNKGYFFLAALKHQPLLDRIPLKFKRFFHPLPQDRLLECMPSQWENQLLLEGGHEQESFSLPEMGLKLISSDKETDISKKIKKEETPMIELEQIKSKQVPISDDLPRSPVARTETNIAELKPINPELNIPFQWKAVQIGSSTHIEVREAFRGGRLKRKKGDFLCQRGRNIRVKHLAVVGKEVSCKSCLHVAKRWQN